MRATKLFMGAVLTAALAIPAVPVLANHPVTVEGNCFGPGAGTMATGLQTSPVPPGSCGDYDGDGRIGAAEDTDMDNNYGSINAALKAVAQNGRVTIVESGTFPEAVRLTPREGASVSLAAAPGVEANIDAVVQGQAGNADRQKLPGIVVHACGACRVAIKNLTVRNWNEAIRLRGHSRTLIDDVRMDGNLNFGLRAFDRSRVTVRDTTIDATGFRKDTTGVNKPAYGTGVRLGRDASASISDSTISNSFGAGIDANRRRLQLQEVQVYGNRPNYKLYG